MFLSKKFLVIPLLLGVFLLAGCVDVEESPADLNLLNKTDSGQIVALDDLSFDWGDISIEGGDVKNGFHFTNAGKEDLVLKGAVTSCMCTTAYIELPNGSISPTFAMHNNEEWTYAVKPGEEFEVEVIYDPMAHGPDAVGPVQRSVFLISSSESTDASEIDSKSGSAVTRIDVKTNALYKKDYENKYGDSDFVFEELEHDFGVVKQSAGFVSYDFRFEYVGDDSIKVTSVPASCACTSAEISKNDFRKGDKGVLTVTFDPNLHEEPEGKFFKTVTLLTEPQLEKQPEVKIWAEMDLDLGPEAYKLKQHID